MAKNDKKPLIRFKGFTDAWEQRKFNNIMNIVTDYVAAGSFADLAENVVYQTSPDYAQLVRTTDLKNGFTSKEQIYVNKHAFNFLWRVNLNKECIIMPNIGNCGEIYYISSDKLPYKHNVLGPNAIFVRSENNDNKFLSFAFEHSNFQKDLALIVSPNGQTKFNKTELKGLDVTIPKIDEQKKIGNLLNKINNLITLHQRKYDKLVNVKKALLDKMFPKNGSKIPEIRFKGFFDAWEQRKFNYFFEERNERSGDGELISVTISSGIKKFSELNRFDTKPEDMSKYKVVKQNDIAYNSMRMWQGASGLSPYNGILSPAYTVITPKANVSSLFFSYQIKKPQMIHLFEINSQGLTKDTWNLKFAPFSQIDTSAPKSFDEQQKIGSLFNNLDNLITLHQRECEKLKNVKKSLLEKMFV